MLSLPLALLACPLGAGALIWFVALRTEIADLRNTFDSGTRLGRGPSI